MAGPKRRNCKHCGRRMDDDYVEIRVSQWSEAEVPHEGGAHKKWRQKTLTTEFICPVCAISTVDRINDYQGGDR